MERNPLDLDALPRIDLRQLLALTDDTGILQHATFLAPDPRHGYCTDDNARALIAALLHAESSEDGRTPLPMQRYLGFLVYAFDERTGRFRNFLSYDRRWLEEVGSEDSHARAVWALGTAVHLAPNESVRGLASQLLRQALPALDRFEHIRPWAFGVIGLGEYLRAEPEDASAAQMRERLAERLYDRWLSHAEPDWPWWEEIVTWGNARLPHALIAAGREMDRPEMREAGEESLRWLLEIQTGEGGHLSLIGNQGWYPRGGQRAAFDQQPLESLALVHACLSAAEATGEEEWVRQAWRCFRWFLGDNDLGQPLYNPNTGGCHDGLTAEGVNQNQGAESTLAYVLSLLELRRFAAVPFPVERKER